MKNNEMEQELTMTEQDDCKHRKEHLRSSGGSKPTLQRVVSGAQSISASVSSRAGSADDGAGGPLLFKPALCPEPRGSYPPRETNVVGDG